MSDGLKAMSESQSVRQAIIYIAQMRTSCLYGADKVYEALCESAVKLYTEGQNEFYEVLLECYFFSADQASHTKETTSLRFFEMTSTMETAAIDICNRSKSLVYLHGLFEKQNILEFVKQAYIDGKLMDHAMFHSITEQFADDERYIEYSELIRQTDGVSLPERKPRVNYEELQMKGRQEFFDALFDKDKAKQLILMLIQETGLVDPTIKELEGVHVKYRCGSPLLAMKAALQNNFCGNEKVTDVVDSADWDGFVLFEVERIIEQEKSVAISPEQEAQLIRLIHIQYEGELVERAIKLNREHHDSISCYDQAVFILAVRFDLVPDESVLLRMIELPYFAFTQDNNEKKYEYLEKHLASELILSRVSDNLAAHRVYGLVLLDHIEYCTKFHYEDVRDYVIEATNNPENDNYIKTAAITYLYHVFGEQCVRRNILPYADEKMLLTIERLCPEIPNEELRTAMECQFKKEATIELMAHLLRLGSEVALCEYIRQAESKMAPPDGRELFSEGPTAAIAALHDPKILPMLEKLLGVALSPDFHDREYSSLYSSLSRALVECGCEAPAPVLTLLQQHKEDSEENEYAFRFFSYTLNELQRKLCAQQDCPWMLQDIKRMFNKTLV